MRIFKARNVDEAWAMFVNDITNPGDRVRLVAPRGKATLEYKEPVCTVYTAPEECVLFDPVRDCNPFFHLYEALWILSGHNDVERVKRYSSQIAEFSDDGSTFNGAYGKRIRRAPRDLEGPAYFDQLLELITMLKKDPDSRRGVLQMWLPNDLGSPSRDVPCNTAVFVKIRDGAAHMSVLNRSNDAVWGCYGANAVQFSVLLQWIAAALSVKVGTLRQISDSLHVYCDGAPGEVWKRISEGKRPPLFQKYDYATFGWFVHPLVNDPTNSQAWGFLRATEQLLRPKDGTIAYEVTGQLFLDLTFMPMMRAFDQYKEGRLADAIGELSRCLEADRGEDSALDAWKSAGLSWLARRAAKREERTVR